VEWVISYAADGNRARNPVMRLQRAAANNKKKEEGEKKKGFGTL